MFLTYLVPGSICCWSMTVAVLSTSLHMPKSYQCSLLSRGHCPFAQIDLLMLDHTAQDLCPADSSLQLWGPAQAELAVSLLVR